jgi:hypothetical protein
MSPAEAESVISCAKDQAVWPWQAEPYRLWSLLDMLRHLAGNWLAATGTLEQLRWKLLFSPEHQIAAREFVKTRDASLEWIKDEIDGLPFSVSLQRQFQRVTDCLRNVDCSSQIDVATTVAQLDELKLNIQSELEAQLFFVVPANRKLWFSEGDTALFGNAVADIFPDSTPEIAEAGRCLALARWTACVFHLMRALELALHKWAIELGVSQFSAIELEHWKNILDAADKKIKQLEQQSKSHSKDAELKYYGETIGHFRSIKDAWRNHVAHARERYDEGRAISIMAHTREFMILLASR